MAGRDPSGQALAVPATPADAVDGPSGFDPSRIDALSDSFLRRDIETVCSRVDPTQPEADTIRRFAELVRHGAKFIDISVRRDGREYHFEGDWLARLFRPTPDEWQSAIATEARRAETVQQGSVHEGAGPKDIARNTQPQGHYR